MAAQPAAQSAAQPAERTIFLASADEAMALFGLGDRNLKLLRESFPVQFTARGSLLRLSGEPWAVERVGGLLDDLVSSLRAGVTVSPERLAEDVRRLRLSAGPGAPAPEAPGAASSADDRLAGERPPVAGDARRSLAAPVAGILDSPPGAPLAGLGQKTSASLESREGGPSRDWGRAIEGVARSEGQAAYLRAILENDVVLCTGPAGTGKTFLAVRMAVNHLREGQVRKLILCRPAVEAGEKLGFLPGDFQAKINPYLRPLYDALNEILDYDQVKRCMDREVIEIIPLAYMRGRTLNDAFIILDEGQNTTISQMKMFLTRMGMRSKIVVNGDTTQVDLPEGLTSGLLHAEKVVGGIPGVGRVQLSGADIVRHPLVKRIVDAYERIEPRRRP